LREGWVGVHCSRSAEEGALFRKHTQELSRGAIKHAAQFRNRSCLFLNGRSKRPRTAAPRSRRGGNSGWGEPWTCICQQETNELHTRSGTSPKRDRRYGPNGKNGRMNKVTWEKRKSSKQISESEVPSCPRGGSRLAKTQKKWKQREQCKNI